jgi:RND superfamily putative drug exporter
MFERWGHAVHRFRLLILGLGVVFLAGAALWGTGVFAALSDGGFEDPDSESARASALADERIGRTSVDVIVLYESQEVTVDDAAFRDAVTDTLAGLPSDHVARTVSYYDTRSPCCEC